MALVLDLPPTLPKVDYGVLCMETVVFAETRLINMLFTDRQSSVVVAAEKKASLWILQSRRRVWRLQWRSSVLPYTPFSIYRLPDPLKIEGELIYTHQLSWCRLAIIHKEKKRTIQASESTSSILGFL